MDIKSVCSVLGPLYRVEKRDLVPCIVRAVGDHLEFEVTGPFAPGKMSVNLWLMYPHRELLAIYSGVASEQDLADTLGYLAFKYQNLKGRIRVEREDWIPGQPVPSGWG